MLHAIIKNEMREIRQRNRIFYIQGICIIIALVIISSNIVFGLLIKENCIPIMYLDKEMNSHPQSFDYPYKDSLPAFRYYKIIKILPETDSIYHKLDKIIRPILLNKDSLNGVKIIFNKNIKYGKYIETINSLLKIGVKTYIPFGDTIFVYYLNRNIPDDILEENIPRIKYDLLIIE